MTLKFQIDWSKDGTFGATGIDNVTDLIRPGGTVSFSYGRDQSTALAPTISGRGSFILDNRDRRFSPRNTASPLFGLLKPARPVKVTRTIGANTYTLFRGHTDDNPINPDTDSQTVTVSLVDYLADLRGNTITTALHSGIRTGDAIDLILDACDWDPGLRDIDPGATIMPWWWEDNTDALNALEKLVQSEGPPAYITQGADGEIVFRDRHHRLQRARSITSQATLRGVPDAGTPYMGLPLTYDEAWRNIINSGIINVDVRTPQAVEAVWTSDVQIVLGASEVKLITASASDPFQDAVVPVAGTDYTLISGAVTPALLRTSGQSATIQLTAGGAGAQINGLQLRAAPVNVAYTVQVTASDAGSVTDYGPRSLPTDLPWCDPATAESVLQEAVALRADPLPIVEATFLCSPAWPAITEKILGLDLSDRVTLYEDETMLNGVDFFVESIAHNFPGEHDHRVTLGLEMAPDAVTPDPDTTFEFDRNVSGHRFNEGVFVL